MAIMTIPAISLLIFVLAALCQSSPQNRKSIDLSQNFRIVPDFDNDEFVTNQQERQNFYLGSEKINDGGKNIAMTSSWMQFGDSTNDQSGRPSIDTAIENSRSQFAEFPVNNNGKDGSIGIPLPSLRGNIKGNNEKPIASIGTSFPSTNLGTPSFINQPIGVQLPSNPINGHSSKSHALAHSKGSKSDNIDVSPFSTHRNNVKTTSRGQSIGIPLPPHENSRISGYTGVPLSSTRSNDSRKALRGHSNGVPIAGSGANSIDQPIGVILHQLPSGRSLPHQDQSSFSFINENTHGVGIQSHGVPLPNLVRQDNSQRNGGGGVSLNSGNEINRVASQGSPFSIIPESFEINDDNDKILVNLHEKRGPSQRGGFTNNLSPENLFDNDDLIDVIQDSLSAELGNDFDNDIVISLGRRFHPAGIPRRTNTESTPTSHSSRMQVQTKLSNPLILTANSASVLDFDSDENDSDDENISVYLSDAIKAYNHESSNERLSLSSSLLNQYNFVDVSGSRKWGYKTDDQYQNQQVHNDGTMEGDFGWVSPSGHQVKVTYVADEGGYRVISSSGIYIKESDNVQRERAKHFTEHDKAKAVLRRVHEERQNRNKYEGGVTASHFPEIKLGLPLPSLQETIPPTTDSTLPRTSASNLGVPLPPFNAPVSSSGGILNPSGFRIQDDDDNFSHLPTFGGSNGNGQFGVNLPPSFSFPSTGSSFGIPLPPLNNKGLINNAGHAVVPSSGSVGVKLPSFIVKGTKSEDIFGLSPHPSQQDGTQRPLGIPLPSPSFPQKPQKSLDFHIKETGGGASIGVPLLEISGGGASIGVPLLEFSGAGQSHDPLRGETLHTEQPQSSFGVGLDTKQVSSVNFGVNLPTLSIEGTKGNVPTFGVPLQDHSNTFEHDRSSFGDGIDMRQSLPNSGSVGVNLPTFNNEGPREEIPSFGVLLPAHSIALEPQISVGVEINTRQPSSGSFGVNLPSSKVQDSNGVTSFGISLPSHSSPSGPSHFSSGVALDIKQPSSGSIGIDLPALNIKAAKGTTSSIGVPLSVHSIHEKQPNSNTPLEGNLNAGPFTTAIDGINNPSFSNERKGQTRPFGVPFSGSSVPLEQPHRPLGAELNIRVPLMGGIGVNLPSLNIEGTRGENQSPSMDSINAGLPSLINEGTHKSSLFSDSTLPISNINNAQPNFDFSLAGLSNIATTISKSDGVDRTINNLGGIFGVGLPPLNLDSGSLDSTFSSDNVGTSLPSRSQSLDTARPEFTIVSDKHGISGSRVNIPVLNTRISPSSGIKVQSPEEPFGSEIGLRFGNPRNMNGDKKEINFSGLDHHSHFSKENKLNPVGDSSLNFFSHIGLGLPDFNPPKQNGGILLQDAVDQDNFIKDVNKNIQNNRVDSSIFNDRNVGVRLPPINKNSFPDTEGTGEFSIIFSDAEAAGGSRPGLPGSNRNSLDRFSFADESNLNKLLNDIAAGKDNGVFSVSSNDQIETSKKNIDPDFQNNLLQGPPFLGQRNVDKSIGVENIGIEARPLHNLNNFGIPLNTLAGNRGMENFDPCISNIPALIPPHCFNEDRNTKLQNKFFRPTFLPAETKKENPLSMPTFLTVKPSPIDPCTNGKLHPSLLPPECKKNVQISDQNALPEEMIENPIRNPCLDGKKDPSLLPAECFDFVPTAPAESMLPPPSINNAGVALPPININRMAKFNSALSTSVDPCVDGNREPSVSLSECRERLRREIDPSPHMH